MSFDFESVIPRRGSGCIKFDRRPDLDPFWVADMDFTSSPAIIQALHARVDHGVFGYAHPHPGLVAAVLDYLLRVHRVAAQEEHIVHLGGLVPALSLAARAFCQPGEALMTTVPIYPPFLSVHRDARAELITVEHAFSNGKWTFDWEKLDSALTPKTRLFILSNPQNPLGRAFSAAEITQLAEFCERHDLILISDEIHCDLILDPASTPHFSAARLPATLQKRIITLLSPSKTYNIAGLGYAYAVIFDDSLRRRFSAARGHTLPEINALGYFAAEAAYRHGEPWRQELLACLRSNRDTLATAIATQLPGVTLPNIEATYLAWLDCRALELPNPADFFEKNAGLFLSDGALFSGPGHVRFNFGCPNRRVIHGVGKMAAALQSR
jgi:cystathionine beta-lyase